MSELAKNGQLFFSDRPILNPDSDALGVNQIAKYLCDVVLSSLPKEGCVIGIVGAWGSGKSSLINLICYHHNRMSSDNKPRLIFFNPWLTSGYVDLTQRLLLQIYNAIDPEADNRSELRSLISRYLKILSYVPFTGVSASANSIADGLGKQQSPEELREKINEEIGQSKYHYIVVVDDIDRLSEDEIRELFRGVKAVADFQNVSYILSYDRNCVE